MLCEMRSRAHRQNFRARKSKVPAGVCIGPRERRQVGTLTCYLRNPVSGKIYLLTAEHVLARHGQPADSKEKIVQPGNDGAQPTAGEVLAEVLESSKNTYADTEQDAHSKTIKASMDWLIAEVSPEDVNPKACGRSEAPAGSTSPKTDSPVVKIGRSTGITNGRYTAQFDRVIRFGPPERGYWARFDKLMLIEPEEPWWRRPFVDSGDSGGPIVLVETNEVIGLAVARSEHGQVWAIPIQTVLKDIHRISGLNLEVWCQ